MSHCSVFCSSYVHQTMETNKLINSSFQAYHFPVLCQQNCRQFSSASLVPSYLSFCSYQILVTKISVDTALEITVISTFILSSSSPAVYHKPRRMWFTVIEVELDWHHIFGWNIVAFQAVVVSCFGQWRMSLRVDISFLCSIQHNLTQFYDSVTPKLLIDLLNN
jgi:hypothetical protein